MSRLEVGLPTHLERADLTGTHVKRIRDKCKVSPLVGRSPGVRHIGTASQHPKGLAMHVRLDHLPLRLATGGFILNSGLSKWRASAETAAGVHGFAKGTYPFLDRIPPERFTKLLAGGEIALGTALLLPFVPSRVAGAGLAGFAGALLGLYLKTPGMREPGSLRPTQQGTAIAKDVWMAGIGTALVLDRAGRSHDSKQQSA
jgi:uncharacterized membrane protein YphA (DoxX/SURF4 family)